MHLKIVFAEICCILLSFFVDASETIQKARMRRQEELLEPTDEDVVLVLAEVTHHGHVCLLTEADLDGEIIGAILAPLLVYFDGQR